MTYRERILAAMRGEAGEQAVWVPRLDLWYDANRRAGTLPEGMEGLDLREIVRELGAGFHAVVPDFTGEGEEATADRLLGIYNVRNSPFEVRLAGVEREVSDEGGMKRVTYRTNAGEVTGVFGWTEEMRAAGTSLPWVREFLVKGPRDCRVLAEIYSNIEVVEAQERYGAWREWVGEEGLAPAYGGVSASPMHHILHQVMGATDFYLANVDWPGEIRMLAESMEGWFEGIFAALSASEAEVVFMGGNFDEVITYPPFFEEHILPWTARLAGMAHEAGKLLLVHTDGENEGLVGLYGECGFDVAESFCPRPMTKMGLEEFAAALPGVTVWGGMASVAMCEESMGEEEFERAVEEAVGFASGRGHVILGIADTMPPWGSFERVRRVGERVAAQG